MKLIPLSEDPEYVGNHAYTPPTARGLAAAATLAARIIEETPTEWLCEAERADGTEIETMSELADGLIARGHCVGASEGTELWLRLASDITVPVKVVEGLPWPTERLNCHYALLVTVEGEGVIIDFTYAQMDQAAPFPYVGHPDQWVHDVMAAAA